MSLKPFLILAAFSWSQGLFSVSDHPTEPRGYAPPPPVPHTSYFQDIDLSLYRSKFEKPVPAWVEETAEAELAFFKDHPITQRSIQATYDKVHSHGYPRTHYLRRFRIIGERIYATGIEEKETDPILRTIARLSDFPGIPDLPNVDFMVNHNDGMPMDYDPPNFWITELESDQAPIFSGGKRADAPYVVVIPHRLPMTSWKEVFQRTLNNRCDWNQKIRAAAWRGNVNLTVESLGYPDDKLINFCMNEPRTKLCSLSQQYPSFVDAGFSANMNWIPSKALLNEVNLLYKGHLTPRDHIRYAYLPILDGAMVSGGGYEWRLLSNSLVFKQKSPYVAWFEKGLKPYEHFIPIERNMEDLIEKVRWAREHDSECERIANNGAAFARDNLSIEDDYYYIFQILKQYEKHQAFKTIDLLHECETDPRWTRIR